MRIGLDISVLKDEQRTGIGVYTYELIKALLEVNAEDDFILFGIASFETHRYLNNLDLKNHPNVRMCIKSIPARLLRRTFILWQTLQYPSIEAFTGDLDIFHSFHWVVPPQRSGKRVATVFDMSSVLRPELHQGKTSQLDALRFRQIARYSDLVIAISQNSQRDFLRWSPTSRVEVIYAGVGEQFGKTFDGGTVRRILARYHLPRGYCLSVATLEPRKNLAFLVDNYLKSGIGHPLVLVGGEGWKNSQLKELIRRHEGRIIATGFVPAEDLSILYQNALCFIYPSLYEGFGLPILEAMASGLAVICSNTSSLPEVGGDAALYVDPFNDAQMQEAVRRISADEKLRERLKQKGTEQVRKFSWRISAQKLNRLYADLVARKT